MFSPWRRLRRRTRPNALPFRSEPPYALHEALAAFTPEWHTPLRRTFRRLGDRGVGQVSLVEGQLRVHVLNPVRVDPDEASAGH